MIHFNTLKKYYKFNHDMFFSSDIFFYHSKTSKTIYKFCVYTNGEIKIYHQFADYIREALPINVFNYEKRSICASVYDERKTFTRKLYKYINGL